MKPFVFTDTLDSIYGEREFYLVHKCVIDEGLSFSYGIEIAGTKLVFSDALDKTLEHFFVDGGESLMPLIYKGQLMDDPKYLFSLQGYELFEEEKNHYKGVIVLYYKAVDIDAVKALISADVENNFPYLVTVVKRESGNPDNVLGIEDVRYTNKKSFKKIVNGKWVLDYLFEETNQTETPNWEITNKQIFFCEECEDDTQKIKAIVLADYVRVSTTDTDEDGDDDAND
jgi:hypothetical protein